MRTHTAQNGTWEILVWNQVSPSTLLFHLSHFATQITPAHLNHICDSKFCRKRRLPVQTHRRPPYTCEVVYHSLSSSKYNSEYFFLSLQVWQFSTSVTSPVPRFQNRPRPYPAAPLLLPSKQHLQKTFAGMPSFLVWGMPTCSFYKQTQVVFACASSWPAHCICIMLNLQLLSRIYLALTFLTAVWDTELARWASIDLCNIT